MDQTNDGRWGGEQFVGLGCLAIWNFLGAALVFKVVGARLSWKPWWKELGEVLEAQPFVFDWGAYGKNAIIDVFGGEEGL